MNLIKPPTIIIRQASLAYQKRVIFENLSLTINSGAWVSILGPSGVGKSSLLKLIAGLQSPNTQQLADIQTDNNVPIQQQIAYLSQADSLLPWLSVIDNLLLGYRLRKSIQLKHPELKEYAYSLLAQIGLSQACNLYPHQLSGGMRQRVAIARTLLENQPVVLMDEPFSSLDAITRMQLQDLACALLKGRSVIFVTHDPLEALRLADSIIILSGSPATIQNTIALQTPSPRAINSATVSEWQAKLFAELLQAKERMPC